MKIIFIANSEKMGGGNKSLISICRSLRERGDIPIVFVPAEGRLSMELTKLKIRKFVKDLVDLMIFCYEHFFKNVFEFF